jgi:hypothetical protein
MNQRLSIRSSSYAYFILKLADIGSLWDLSINLDLFACLGFYSDRS